jgi:outer membrane protein
MKKIIIIAAMALVSLAATAQETKLAYVDFNEVIMLMPEMDAARATLEENEMTQNEILQSMYEELQTKYQQYQQKAESWTPAIRQSKEAEITEIQARFEQTQQSFANEISQLQQELQAPIVEKAQNAINELAKAKGVAVVFEKSSMIYIDPAQCLDLTPEARKNLNIPEGRTLETLQAEMMAKAQAAQAAQAQ